MNCKTCKKCGARWMESKHYWSTGASGNELDLAGLVCNNLKEDDPDAHECINPQRGKIGGDTWDYRRGFAEGLMTEAERSMKARQNEEG